MAELLLGAAALYLGWKVGRKAHRAYQGAKQEMYEERGYLDYGDPYGYYPEPNSYYGSSSNYYPSRSGHHHHSNGRYGSTPPYSGYSRYSSGSRRYY